MALKRILVIIIYQVVIQLSSLHCFSLGSLIKHNAYLMHI